MSFIDRFMEALENKGISQYKLCKDLEIGQSTISSWKKGKMPTTDKIIAIVRYLEVSADWLLETDIESLTPEEKKLLEEYRAADDRGKRRIVNTAKEELQEVELSTYNNGKEAI